jgi:hypothetical protein
MDQANAWREVFNYGKALQLGVNLLDGGLPISQRLIPSLTAPIDISRAVAGKPLIWL